MKNLLAVFCISLFPFLAEGQEYASCCESRGSWSVGGEWLYFMPSFDQSEFLWNGLNQLAGVGIGDRVGEKQRYYSAFRVEASYLFCNQMNALTFRYTNFHKNYFTDVSVLSSGNQILGLAGDTVSDTDPASVAFERDYRYYNVEGLFTFYTTCLCNFTPTFSTGIKFVHLHIKENANYNFSEGSQFVQPDMSAWALGPCLEFDSLYSLTSCFNVTGRFLWGLLADQSCSKMTVKGGPAATDRDLLVKNTPRFWHVNQTLDTRLGLNFEKTFKMACACFHIDIEGGYELLNELNILSRIYNTDSRGWSFNEWTDFTLNGPYLRVNFSY